MFKRRYIRIDRHIDRDVKEYKEKNNYPIKRKR